ncbi:unnamed protein product, partial [Amoebophrya sp. A120]
VKQERKLREQRRKLLGSAQYESWILSRRLKASEKLRRRRILLEFNPETDDAEETHRRLQRVNRRLGEISDAAAQDNYAVLEKTGRRLVAEDDEQDRALRYLLDDESHIVSNNLHVYSKEYGVKPTSRQMRELMTLTHAGKRNLVSLDQIGDNVMNFLMADDVAGLKNWAVNQMQNERVALPKQMILKLLAESE